MGNDCYGYGIIEVCDACSHINLWNGYNIGHNYDSITGLYLLNKINPLCLEQIKKTCTENNGNSINNSLVNNITNIEPRLILEVLDRTEINLSISEVPQFNNFYNATKGMIDYLMTVDSTNYLDAGTFFTDEHNKPEARRKYGEEHLKLSTQLGFSVMPTTNGLKKSAQISPFGIQCATIEYSLLKRMIPKLIMRVPIISYMIKKAKTEPVSIRETMFSINMKESTINRRGTCIKTLLSILNQTNDDELQLRLTQIQW
jgi:hypothetical protein